MKTPTFKPTKKVKATLFILGSITLMTAGYFAISAGISFTNRELDTFAVARVKDRGLISKTVTVKEVPVITTMDIKGQVNAAIASNLK